MGASEVLASLIMIAITLVAGAASFGFVNGQTASAANQVGSGVSNNVNYLREREAIAVVNFDNNTGVSAYVYNNGAEILTINSFVLTGPTCIGVSTNCAVASQITATVSYVRTTNTWSISGVGLTCTGKSTAGLTNIGTASMSRLSIKLTGCTFVFAASPTLPAVTAPPLTNSFSLALVGQFGSTSTTLVTR